MADDRVVEDGETVDDRRGDLNRDEIDEEVRRYLVRQARRYAPPLVLFIALLLVAALVPITGRGDHGKVAANRINGGEGSTAGDTGVVSGGASTDSGSATAGQAVAGGATGRAGGVSGATNGRSGGESGGVPGTGATASTGTTRNGAKCSPGVRQVSWTKYAPNCVAAFSGANGGATGQGVTASTITLSYRRSNSGEQTAITAIAGQATPNDDTYLQDMNTYLSLFNKQYELYGRQVVLKPFQGQGDYLQEDIGQGQEQAQADAVTAHDLNAFADVTFPSAGSLFYSQALAAEKVLSWGFPYDPQSWYEKYAPYQYNFFLDGSKWAHWAANTICARMNGLPAVFAGDSAMQSKNRVFGLVAVEFPTWLQSADEIQRNLDTQCGVKMARRVTYPEDISTMQQNGSNIAAQMRAAGVTTVVCFCDPLMPIFVTQSATQQNYRPEWIFQNDYDPISQDADQSQFAHAIAPGPPAPPVSTSEALKAYQLVRPGGKPAEIYYLAAYEVLLQVFGALQAAGPNLNPQTFQQGMFGMPASLPGGDYGDWGFGPGGYTPTSALGVVWWNTKATSPNGKAGTWTACDDNAIYPFNDPTRWGTAHTQLRCFGR